eukprot:m.438296 g.438296  ORF g.438296 m.438296 type:complete len:192 (-) comp21444_c0_seq4:1045-1620(-)
MMRSGIVNRFSTEQARFVAGAHVDEPAPHKAPVDGGLESFSNLPLQVLLHFNTYFYIAWAAAVLIVTERNANGPWSFNLTGILYCTLFVLEPLRILMGYFGNLAERISGLAAFGLVTFFLSVPSGLYIMYDSRNPAILALNIVFNVVLLSECIFTYGAMDKMSQHESAHHHVLNPTLGAHGFDDRLRETHL